MLTDENLKALLEGIIYVAPEPVTIDGMLKVLEGEERERVKAKLDELVADYEQSAHGIQIRQVANGYKFSSKAEHHEVLRKYVKSLKAPIRLSKPALETLAVIAYRQPVTMPEIEAIRGVDAGGVIHTLLEKKLVTTSGRKNVIGRPILYRTSKDFLVHFGLKDVGELPSLKEFEELAKRALGSEWTAEQGATTGESAVGAAAESSAPASEATSPTPVSDAASESSRQAESPVAAQLSFAESATAAENVAPPMEPAAAGNHEPRAMEESSAPTEGASEAAQPAEPSGDAPVPPEPAEEPSSPEHIAPAEAHESSQQAEKSSSSEASTPDDTTPNAQPQTPAEPHESEPRQ